ncbi:hypothetical protein F5148DRAFT_1231925 [Russula earlei]|uniref:Uncharacterized protein n=1 Tax=Russula earlei TaxID=71964 RepID=A0ACC0TYH4_9AGAM|nr:hypothetical protein F5148DRAFT_1231925 [Russula earlei]
MSHSPAPPPQLSNNANNNNNTHSNTSPSQLALILSTVLADNETLSKDLAVARARYERAEQTLALLKPPHTSVAATGDAPSPPSVYPEPAVRAIMDLQSHLEAEKVARESAESRMRAISEAWFDLDRYLQASEVHISDARSHFSQQLRDPSIKPSFNPLPAYQPHRSHQSAPRVPVVASQTFPQPSGPASLPARVRHRDDNAEDAPPPKRLRTDRVVRHPIESSRIHTQAPPSYSTPEMNHHLHPAYSAQQPFARGRRLERRDQSPSLSHSPTRSRSSSMSLDELLLEATDNKRASPSSPQPTHAYSVPPSYYRPVSTIRPSSSPDHRSPHTIRRDTAPQPNIVSPAITSTTQPPPQSQPHGQYQTLQTHIFAPPVTGPPGKKPKANEGTPVSTATSARSVTGAASHPSLPPGGFPAVNDKGQRICRQCGLPGRYKDGKCVEKWGPGPEGPGTVCDRCRKKMKRVERRGTLDPHSQTASFVQPRTHAPIQERDRVHGTSASQGTDRSISRTDTVVGPLEARERDAVSPRSNSSSVTVARPKGDAAHSGPSSRSHSRSPLPLTAHPQRNGSQVQLPSSKLPLPLSSGEGESDAEGELEAEAVDAAEASSGKGAMTPWVKREIEAA